MSEGWEAGRLPIGMSELWGLTGVRGLDARMKRQRRRVVSSRRAQTERRAVLGRRSEAACGWVEDPWDRCRDLMPGFKTSFQVSHKTS